LAYNERQARGLNGLIDN